MAKVIQHQVIPENDKKKQMQMLYDTSLQSVQNGLKQDILQTGTLDDKRDFFVHVMSAGLYGKQLAAANGKPYVVPEIEVQDNTDAISVDLRQFVPTCVSRNMIESRVSSVDEKPVFHYSSVHADRVARAEALSENIVSDVETSLGNQFE